MVRSLLAGVVLFTLSASAQQPKKASETKVRIGDSAPAFAPAVWLSEKKATGIEKDKITIVDFFSDGRSATFSWSVPVLSELHEKYAEKGLAVIAVIGSRSYGKPTEKDLEMKKADAVKEVEKLKPPYPVAFDADAKFTESYIADSTPFNYAFVIDKDGKVAYVGSTIAAAYAAEKLLAGTWNGKADADAIAAALKKKEKLADEIMKKHSFKNGKPDAAALKAFRDDVAELEAVYKEHPFLLKDNTTRQLRPMNHFFCGNDKEFDAILSAEIEWATRRKDTSVLSSIAFWFTSMLTDPTSMPKASPAMVQTIRKFVDAACKLADAETDRKDKEMLLFTLAILEFNFGTEEKSKKLAEKAFELMPVGEREKGRKGYEEFIMEIKKQKDSEGK
jgi:hypothetical protein